MANTLKYLRALADPTRLRIIALLHHEELSVQELQEITRLCQSRISTHLGLLQETSLLSSRREGKRTFYRLSAELEPEASSFINIAVQGASETPEHADDKINLRRVLLQRQDKAQVFFNQVAGRFDRSYGPGRSWQAFGQLLLRIIPQIVVADLGSGEGLVSELLARRARKVIAVDNSEKIVAYGAAKAKKNGIKNLEFRLGDLEDPPIEPASVDLVILSQALHHAVHPDQAIRAAYRILRAGGQIILLDLLQHQYQQARELHGDLWLGFSEGELHRWLDQAGFVELELAVVSREETAPHLQTLLAYGDKPKQDSR
jgi:ubiquinone/menaquinone biosynthesis C-methylase UbiE/DNA-binding transcriptional ArsR family regulator